MRKALLHSTEARLRAEGLNASASCEFDIWHDCLILRILFVKNGRLRYAACKARSISVIKDLVDVVRRELGR